MPAYQFGAPVIPLSQVIDELHIAQGNVKHSHIASDFVHARWIWKKLFWNTLWQIQQKVIEVTDRHPEDCGCNECRNQCTMDWPLLPKSEPIPNPIQKEYTGRVKLPSDMVRLISISVMDKCGNQQPLAYNPYINTVDMSCPPVKCSCVNCGGNDTLCAVLDQLQVTTEDITINGTVYTKRTWIRKDERGDLLQVSNIPVLGTDGNTIVYIEQKEILCNLEVDENSCIKYTEPNRELLLNFCGCYIPWVQFGRCNKDCRTQLTKYESRYGEYNWDAKAGNILHLKHVKAERVIVAYQTSGEDLNDEILIPEIALEAMIAGIYWRQRWVSPAYSQVEKQESRFEFNRCKTELFKFLNPVKITDLMDIAGMSPKWATDGMPPDRYYMWNTYYWWYGVL